MSYFLTGRFQFTRDLSTHEQIDVAFQLVERAISNRVALQLGCNIAQSIVFEILGKEPTAGRELLFLLTDSPISDTSDELLTYWGESQEQIKTKVKSIGTKIRDFLASTRSIDCIARVNFFISEGYDTSYRREEVSLESVVDRLAELAEEYDWLGFPSVEVVVQF